jgi:hypothetical protein
MKIEDFFDPYDIEHLKAWQFLENTAHWPEGFIPKNTEFGQYSFHMIKSKMADAWVKWKLDHTEG